MKSIAKWPPLQAFISGRTGLFFLVLLLILLGPFKPGFAAPTQTGQAVFAGGCFWCMEAPFEKLKGVSSVVSGFAGGKEKEASYKAVSAGKTGHREAVQITFDPKKVSYAQLVEIFWHQINPIDAGGQFADRGFHYTTAIFYLNEEQKKTAEQSKVKLDASKKFDKPVATVILKANGFYPAEEDHQDYYKKNSDHYLRYRKGSGREDYINKTWGGVSMEKTQQTEHSEVKPKPEELKKTLSPLQYEVTQKNGTERPFQNEYWDNHREGLYVDIVSGEVLFSSKDKFESGTGWPSFTKPIEDENVVEKKDTGLMMVRTEVRSKHGDSHLGHVFEDGPAPNGLRYCINSASLRFIPKESLEKEGYGKYRSLFQGS